jgi:serine/threonine-protein kinase HipA
MATTNSPERLPRVSFLHVGTPQGYAGILAKAAQHSFTYETRTIAQNDQTRSIAISMPVRAESYATTPLLPVFQTSLPEGYLLERIRQRFSKIVRMDDMALLALSGSNRIGRVRVATELGELGRDQPNESLREILENEGSRDLFDELCDRYLISSGIAGIQPKVVLAAHDDADHAEPSAPAKEAGSVGTRATLRSRELIVKASAADFPALAENEYHCLEIARRAGLEVPKTWLSDDSQRLVIERFDIDRATGMALGFEDMVSITGRVNEKKYEGSYEMIAQALDLNCSPAHVASSKRALFQNVVLSVILRNGDAHLKNFGLLYTNPSADDVRLSPVYDLVCTTVYIVKDQLALSLGKEKKWPTNNSLVNFGVTHCGVRNAKLVVEQILTAATEYRPKVDRTSVWTRMQDEISRAALGLNRQGATIRGSR